MRNSISTNQLRDFGLFIGLVFPLFIGWLLPVCMGHSFRVWTLWVGIPALVLGLCTPRLLYYPFIAWMALGHILGWVNSHVILGIVFFVILQPIAYVMRLTGYDPLRKSRKGFITYKEVRKNYPIDLTRIF